MFLRRLVMNLIFHFFFHRFECVEGNAERLVGRDGRAPRGPQERAYRFAGTFQFFALCVFLTFSKFQRI